MSKDIVEITNKAIKQIFITNLNLTSLLQSGVFKSKQYLNHYAYTNYRKLFAIIILLLECHGTFHTKMGIREMKSRDTSPRFSTAPPVIRNPFVFL